MTPNPPNQDLNWDKLNERFLERRSALNRFYDSLVAKRDKTFISEENILAFNEKRNLFQEFANNYFEAYLNILGKLSGQEDLAYFGGYTGEITDIFNNITISYSKWEGLPPDPELKKQANIFLRSPLSFGPFGFTVNLVFTVDTNPETHNIEFRLTAYGGSKSELPSEREKQTLLILSFSTEEDYWRTNAYKSEDFDSTKPVLNSQKCMPLIEKEIYKIIDHFLYGGGMKTYRNVDFIMSTRLPR